MNNTLNMVLQGKGGVGKSLIASLLAQYFEQVGTVLCADTDPVNATFTQYKALDVAHVEIAENGNIIQRKFDPLMETILNTQSNFVIDNGAATFMPLTGYLAENEIFQMMSEAGKKVIVHTVLTGGQSKSDTYNGFAELLDKIGANAKVVVWENEFWGKVEYEGHPITDTKLFKEADKAGKIAGIVKIIERKSDTFSGDIKQMTENHLTLAEVLESPDFNFLAKRRLQKIITEVFDDLNKVSW
jgi:hypothetical protein